MSYFDRLLAYGNRNAGGGAPVGGISGPEANVLPYVADRELVAMDEEMARRAAMTRDRGEVLPQLPPNPDMGDWDFQWDLPQVAPGQRSGVPLSAARMSGRR